MDVDPDLPVVDPDMDDLGSMGMPLPPEDPDEPMMSGGAGQGGGPMEPGATPPGDGEDDGGCAVRAPGAQRGPVLLALWLLGLAWLHRRVRARAR
jgi:MYXO-CTERM domain-containing protein